ncbi:hypothetical protein FQB35_11955 [Crassaminicella thermophila]|uniref:ABC-transporter type IV n=2 Tax=Crassaminicella thermophila TaxID=2599308 RepID=A0A5C0SIZ5_CRATE|nr:hypothetical protein FQB35_11955 [Crassaminicella thermophila]
MKQFLRNFIIIALISFIFQAAWEYLSCGLFYAMDTKTATSPLMWSATFGDVMMTVTLYVILSFVNGNSNWIVNKWKSKEYIIISLYALFLSFYFEISALYSGRWAYSEAMPLFPNTNIGLIPVIQLLILFPFTFFISKFIIKAINK